MQDRNNSSSRSGGGDDRKPRRSGQSGRTDGNRSRRGKGRGQQEGRGRGPRRGSSGRSSSGRSSSGRSPSGRGAPQSGGARGRKPERGHKPAPFKQKTIHLPTTYDVLFYKTLREAEADEPRIRAKAAAVDQFNVVVEAEDLTEDYAFADVAELYCGAAWTLIHRRRVEDGWYSDRLPDASTTDSPQD